MKWFVQEDESRWGRILGKKWATYALLAILTVCYWVTYSQIYDTKLDLNGDNIYYYSLGKALSDGKGFTDIMWFEERPHSHFPPGYPLFVAGLMKIVPDSVQAVKIANGILLYAAILLLFFLLKKMSGDVPIAFLSCLFTSVHPEILRYATIMMSEILFLFCTVSALYLAISMKVEKIFTKAGIRDTVFFVLLVVLMNYIYFVRTMGMSFILALIVYAGILLVQKIVSYLKKKSVSLKDLCRYGIFFSVLAISFLVTRHCWNVRNENIGKVQSDYIADFKKKPGGQVMSTWPDWAERIGNNYNAYLNDYFPTAVFAKDYRTGEQGGTFRGYALAFCFVLGLLGLRKGGLLMFLYLGATVAVLLVWPEQYSGLRYFIALIPLLIFLFYHGIRTGLVWILSRLKIKWPASIVSTGIVALALLFAMPAYAKALERPKMMAKDKEWTVGTAGNAFVEFVSAMQWCGANLPDSARVICRKPELYFMYSGNRKGGNFPQYGEPEVVYQSLVGNKATHVIIDHWFRHAYVTLFPLIQTYYPEKFRLIQIFKNQMFPSDPPTLLYEFHPEWGEEVDSAGNPVEK